MLLEYQSITAPAKRPRDCPPRPPRRLATLIDIARWRAVRQPADIAFTFLVDGETDEANVTYAEFDARARAIARQLQQRRLVGERVLLLFEPGLDFNAAVFGCFYAGAVAVPVYPPDPYRAQRTLPRLHAILEDAQARLTLGADDILSWSAESLRQHGCPETLPISAIDPAEADAWKPLPSQPKRLALLQYTSGSTGTPKGVMLTHANLLHNLAALHRVDIDGAVAVGWVPPFHDMGLIGNIFLPIHSGRRMVLMSPLRFVERPARWLWAMSRYRARTTAGPNFGYELCVRKVTAEECEGLDLSAWLAAINGAEPVRVETIDRFIEKFAPYGLRREVFYPAYGMAEATLLVTANRRGDPPRIADFSADALEHNRAQRVSAFAGNGHASAAVRRLVGCGRVTPQSEIVLVDPETRKPLPPGQVGEIWLRSPSVGLGYWNRPEESHRVFRARLAGRDDRTYLRTGDLGFIDHGELFITGRLKDLIILAGRNFYPQDIERIVEGAHPAAKASGGAAFSIEHAGEERLVIVQETVRAKRYTSDDILAAIRRELIEEIEISPHAIVLIPGGALPKTSSGKTRRRVCREMYLSGELPVLAQWPASGVNVQVAAAPQTATEQALARLWSDLLGVARIGRDDDFFVLGGQSLRAMDLLVGIRTAFGVDLPIAALMGQPTLAGLAAEIDARSQVTQLPDTVAQRPQPLSPGPQPLSFAQEGFWFFDRLTKGQGPGRVGVSLALVGPLDSDALAAAWTALVERQASLRTRFAEVGGHAAQIASAPAPALEWVDLGGVSGRDQQSTLASLQEDFAQRPLDLEKGPPCHAALVRLSDDRHVLLLVLHHIVCDGWSLEIVRRELAALYAAKRSGTATTLPSLPFAYADFAAWQRTEQIATDADVDYWKTRLAGMPPTLDLPFARQPDANANYEGQTLARALASQLIARLYAIASNEKVTPFTIFLAAYGAVLARYAGSRDLCIGTAAARRDTPGVEQLVGCFVNTVPLRLSLDTTQTFAELLATLRPKVCDDLVHGATPFGTIVEAVQPQRQTGRLPLVQAMLLYQDRPLTQCEAGNVRFGELQADYRRMAPFEVTLAIEPRESGFSASLVYNARLFDEAVMAAFLDALIETLAAVADEPQKRLDALPIPARAETLRLLTELNATACSLPNVADLHELFAACAAERPDRLAVCDGQSRLTYAELDVRANRLAHLLQAQGVGPDALVGLHLGRSVETVVALLAVLKAGGAYVPLDPSYPAQRLALMAKNSHLTVLLTEPAARAYPAPRNDGPHAEREEYELDCPIIDLAAAAEAIAREPSEPPPCHATGEHLAYVLYTSGSTGVPKGVMVPRRALVNFAVGIADELQLDQEDCFLALTTISFDIAALELLVPLTLGARIALVDRATAVDGPRLAATIGAEGVTVLQATPSTYRMLQMSGWRPQPYVKLVCGGEALDSALAAELLAGGTELWNVYGPTETTVWSTACRIENADSPVPIGRPLANQQVYVLDPERRLVPIGTQGELYIGGLGVARGYLNQPELTAERFVADPFRGETGRPLYRTGDRVRWRADGVLEFLGRLDNQVKVRGFRVELGEVEAALVTHAKVAQAAIAAWQNGAGQHYLAAYVVSRNGRPPTPEQLRSHLHQRLPDYMLPTAYVVLPALPRTPAGKLDRAALPDPKATGLATTTTCIAPRTETEARVAAIWVALLRVNRVGALDNFFELGGHSLVATQLAAQLQTAYDVEVPIRALLEDPTVAGHAALVERLQSAARPQQRSAIARADRTGPLPVSFAQERLWLLNAMEPDSSHYNMPVALRLHGPVEHAALQSSLAAIVARHESLRTSFVAVAGRPQQVIAPELAVDLPLIDLSALDAEEQEAEVRRLTDAQADAPFDLAASPLWRIALVRLSATEHVVLWTMHHIIADGWSMGVLLSELTALYDGIQSGQTTPLPNLALQYADFAVWQRAFLASDACAEQLAYWKHALADLPELNLPTDRPRPALQTFAGGQESLRLSGELAASLRRLAGEENGTLFAALLAAFQVLLYRYTGQHDIAVGTGIANRNRAELEPLVGFFVNALVMRTDLSGSPSFRELLGRVRDVCHAAYDRQDVPFDQVVEALQPDRQANYNPLCRVFLIYQNFPLPLDRPEFDLRDLRVGTGTAKFDLTLFVRDERDGLLVTAEYSADLFDRATITRLLGHFHELLTAAAADGNVGIGDLRLLTADEERQILGPFCHEGAAFPIAPCAHEVIEQVVAALPDAVAVSLGEQTLTYDALNCRANQLARWLRRAGVGPDVIVALCFRRSLEMIVTELAVMKAGGAYLPLDPDYPAARLHYMLEHSQTTLLLTEPGLREALPPFAGRTVCPGELPELASLPDDNLVPCAGPDHLAYVIYTSGSTGRPKGVAICHTGLSHLIHGQRRLLHVHSGDRVLQFSSPGFDAAVWEVYLALCAGARLCLAAREELMPGHDLLNTLQRNEITVATLTPTAWNALPTTALPHLRLAIAAGEACPGDVVARWAPGRRFVNGYGPTETTVCTSLGDCAATDARPSIGRPLPNFRVYVFDARLRPQPVGVPGELYVGGPGLARGYLHSPALTAERFIADPFGPAGSRLYRTGDRVRWLADGRLDFLGRSDQQVKIRGFRIEPDEIETVLAEHPAVQQAAVRVVTDGRGDPRLVGYFVPRPQHGDDNSQAAAWRNEQIDQWRTLYETTYRQAAGDDPTFNIVGWQSSYTGAPIPAAEMREWRDETVARILALRPRRVLEIGCGSGLLLFPIAPHVDKYCGVDISAAALQSIEGHLAARDDLRGRVALRRQPASDFSGFAPESFDIVVLNSVAQYFPDVHYLLDVLRNAVRVVRPGGAVYVGDVRSYPLLEAFCASVEFHKAPATLTAAEFRQRVRDRVAREEELTVDPQLFRVLRRELPQLGHVQILPKQSSAQNELTKFRYEAILHIGQRRAEPVAWQSWPPATDLSALVHGFLRSRPGEAMGLRGVPNARLAEELAILAWHRDADPHETIAQLHRSLRAEAPPHAALAMVRDVARELGCAVAVACPADERQGVLDVCFSANGIPPDIWNQPSPDAAPVAWERFANNPLRQKAASSLIGTLREHLRNRLPEFMVPSVLMALDAMPLTAHGKLDQRALPLPDGLRPDLAREYVAPRTPTERLVAEVFSATLLVDRVGICDNFFELGGHSMLAVQVIAEVERRIGRRLPLAALFQGPTVEHLARLVDAPAGGEASSLVTLAAGGRGAPLFCVHPAGGTVFCYRPLAERLAGSRPVYGLQAVGIDGTRAPHTSLEAMAAEYLVALRAARPHGPYALCGWSLGGNIAFEMARQLREQDAEVALVALFDAGATPGERGKDEIDFHAMMAELFAGERIPSLAEFQAKSMAEQVAFFVERASRANLVVAAQPEAARAVFEVFKANLQALGDYRPRPYPGTLALFTAAHDGTALAAARDPYLGWTDWASEVCLLPTDCHHLDMLNPPAIDRLAEQLLRLLAEVDTPRAIAPATA